MEWLALGIAFIIAGLAFAMVFGKASRLGHCDEREKRRDPLDIDEERL